MKLEVLTHRPSSHSNKPPMLFVHGMWHGAWCWEEYFLPFFAERGYLACALSLRGHGGSEGRRRLRWTPIKDYVADVAQVAGSLDQPPVLIGHSMGGFVVQKYLEHRTVPGAVLLASTPPFGAVGGTVRTAARHPLAVLKTALTLSVRQSIATPELARDVLFSKKMPEPQVRTYWERLQDDSMRAFLDQCIFSRPRTDRITAPIMVLGAGGDAVFSVGEIERTAAVYGTSAHIFPDMGHNMMLETGWERVAERILQWLVDRGL